MVPKEERSERKISLVMTIGNDEILLNRKDLHQLKEFCFFSKLFKLVHADSILGVNISILVCTTCTNVLLCNMSLVQGWPEARQEKCALDWKGFPMTRRVASCLPLPWLERVWVITLFRTCRLSWSKTEKANYYQSGLVFPWRTLWRASLAEKSLSWSKRRLLRLTNLSNLISTFSVKTFSNI